MRKISHCRLKCRSAFQCCIDPNVLACKAIGLGLHNQYNRGYEKVLQVIWQRLSNNKKDYTDSNSVLGFILQAQGTNMYARIYLFKL